MIGKKVAIIGGASRGIGAACAKELLQRDWKVAGLARGQVAVEEESLMGIPVDLMDAGAIQEAVNRVLHLWGCVDAVIHTAGDIFDEVPIAQLSWKRCQQTLDACLRTAVNLTQAVFLPILKSHGTIVYIASIAARRNYPGIVDYCAAKAALVSYMRGVADELAPNARANSISPGVVDTDLFRKSRYTEKEAASWHKLRRLGKPQEIAQICGDMLKPGWEWVTGQDIMVDGGMLL